MRAAGRWCATAVRSRSGWLAGPPEPVGRLPDFVERLCTGPATLAGFDFPIGLPRAFGLATGLPSFVEALGHFGTGEWKDFFRVARLPVEISPRRPFYPDAPGGCSHRQLLDGLKVEAIGALLRSCERAHGGRGAASPLFWTMGAKQVGKAAINGWQEVLQPAVLRRCRLWPFEGDLETLSGQGGGAVLAETYPAEAYGHVGIRFGAREGKGRQSDRAGFAGALHAWAGTADVTFEPRLVAAIEDGFGSAADGSDRFDATVGLFGMIEVVGGRRAEAPPGIDTVWEGWILGQAEGRG